MLRKATFAGLILIAMLAVSFLPAGAAGPVYPDLPDLGGQEIVIAVENLYTPFQFENPQTGEIMGYEYDLVEEICQRIHCTPVYEFVSWDVMITSVGEDQFDLGMTGISIIEERKEVVDFSDPYINLQQFLLVRADEDRFANIEEFAADDSLLLGVQAGTAGFFVTLDAVPDEARRVVYTEFGALVQALRVGDVDAIPVDAAAARGFISTTGGAVKTVGEAISDDQMGFIFPKGSDLVEPMNAAIASLKQDGFLDFLLNKWFFDYNPETGDLYADLPDLGGQEIVIAVENLYLPFQFEEATTGEIMGYEYDLVEEICQRINCTPVYEFVSWDVMIASVSEGQFDLGMTGISIIEERKEIVDFSDPYINLQQFLLVRADEDRFADIGEFAADDSLLLGVQAGTAGFFVTLDAVPDEARRVVYTEFGALVQALIVGDVDAIPVDAAAARGFISTTGGAVKTVGEAISDDQMGFIFPKGSDLVEPMNAAIASVKQDGFLDFLLNKWFFDYQPPA
ncbi:MAG: transporter substrate-binding domain-containing protein [Anaerolineae bacterium]|nr:transporter substrate-binding domain-containing protein [Anaerolineae bacterium]